MLAHCKNCAYGHKAQHSACEAQCASGQAASRNDLCSLYNYTLIIMFREIGIISKHWVTTCIISIFVQMLMTACKLRFGPAVGSQNL